MEFEENNVEIEGNSTRNLKKKHREFFYSGTNFYEPDEGMIELKFICEELNVQLKLVFELILISKQKKPHLKQRFTAKKQSLFYLIHFPNQMLLIFFLFLFQLFF